MSINLVLAADLTEKTLKNSNNWQNTKKNLERDISCHYFNYAPLFSTAEK